MMQDNTENLPYFYFELQDPRNGNKIIKTFPMTQESMEQKKELDKLAEQYNEDFKNIFDNLCPQFDERLSAIGGWIYTEYHIMPTQKEFINWFIRKKIGTYKIKVNFRLDDNVDYSDHIEEHREYIDWWFPDYKNTFIPNLIDDYLLEYCQEYVNDLKLKREKILLQLPTPAPKEIEQGKETFDFDREIEALKTSENQFHKGLPMDFVINHFKVFYENNKKTEYLSKESFLSFIKRGFLNDDTQPIQKINFNTGETGLVILRFYEFFDNAVRMYSHPNKKANFIKLVLRCFDNLGTETQIKSFLKHNKTAQSW